jgi:RHS repeat-associated protein
MLRHSSAASRTATITLWSTTNMGTVRYEVINGRVIAEKRSGVRRLYVPDPLGNTIALLDNTQAKTDTFSFWPYGEQQSRTGTTPTPFQYGGTLGYYHDSASRNYVRKRVLKKDQGRWLTVDPLRLLGIGADAYCYCSDRPTVLSDPTGLRQAWPITQLPVTPPQPNCSGFKPKQGPWKPLPRDEGSCRGCLLLCQKGDVWACNGYWACMNMGWPHNRPGSNCVRGCLQFQMPFNQAGSASCADIWCTHQFCFKVCGWGPDWPLPWRTFISSCCGEFQ